MSDLIEKMSRAYNFERVQDGAISEDDALRKVASVILEDMREFSKKDQSGEFIEWDFLDAYAKEKNLNEQMARFAN